MKQPEFGKKVTQLRKEKGLTQEELACKVKVSTRTIQRIEAGKGEPSNFSKCNLCEVLEYPLSNKKTIKINRWLSIMHISTALCLLPIPLFVWIFKKKDNDEINLHGRDIVNFQLTMILLLFGATLFTGIISLTVISYIRSIPWDQDTGFMPIVWITISILPFLILGIICIINGIGNTIKVLDGRNYSFPFLFKII